MPGADFSALQPDPKQVFQKAARNSEFIETYSLAPRTCCVLLKNASQDFWSVISDGTIWTTISPNIFHPDMVCSFENLKKKTKKNKTDFKGLRSEDEFFYSEVVKMDFVSFNTFIAPHWSWTVLRASIWARTIINTVHMRVKPNPMLCFFVAASCIVIFYTFAHSFCWIPPSTGPSARLPCVDATALFGGSWGSRQRFVDAIAAPWMLIRKKS